jgi:hypothetical protein
MPITITINNITGATPFDIYICSNTSTQCIYRATISTFPADIDVPSIMLNQLSYKLKVIDDNGCEIIKILTL